MERTDIIFDGACLFRKFDSIEFNINYKYHIIAILNGSILKSDL